MSASIEERVVSIKFDNSKFEANVRTTMTSLESLKKSMDFSGSIRALSELDAAGKNMGNLKFDNKQFVESVQSTIGTANKLKTELKFDGAVKGLSDLEAAGKNVKLELNPKPFQEGAKGILEAANTIKANLNFASVQSGIGNLKTSIQGVTFESMIAGSRNAIKSLQELDLAGKAVSFASIGQGSMQAQQSISAMSIAGIAALGALAFKAVSVGLQMGKSLFVDPAKSGLAEYETNLNSIQTILANTESKGSTIDDVNRSLEELNEYSDQTIYNFSDMAKAIGTFTTAGVDLDTSTASIKGLSNVAAMSGANATQASGAMEQLSRAMSSGKVALQDWMSIETAGMASEAFRNSLMETARTQGVAVDDMVAKNGSFRLSLQEGWLTTDIMTDTLDKFTGDLSDAQLAQQGYNQAEIEDIQRMAKTAKDAAQKVKTFTQLVGTLKETSGSGWAKSAQLILGDFNQAKEMWTAVNDTLGGMLKASADSRNKLLGDWNQFGGRTEMIWAVSAAFKVLMGILNPIKEAFREVFPPTTGKQLYEITQGIRLFIEALIPGEQATSLLKNTFKLLFTIIKIGVDIIKGALSVVFAFFKAFATGGDSIAGSMKPLTDFMAKVATSLQNSKFVENFFAGLARAATVMGGVLGRVVPLVVKIATAIFDLGYTISGIAMYEVSHFARIVGGTLLDAFEVAGAAIVWVLGYLDNLVFTIGEVAKAFLTGGIDAALSALSTGLAKFGAAGDLALTRVRERLESFARLGDRIAQVWDSLSATIARVWEKMLPVRQAISKMFEDIKMEIKKALGDVNFDDTLDMVNTGLLAGLVFLFRNTFKKMLGMGDGVKDGILENLKGTFESVNGVLDGLTGTLEAMQQNLKADTLMKIAIAIGILTLSVVVLSMIDSGKLTKALVGIGVMIVILTKAMEALDKITMSSGFLKIPVIAASMILLAIALGLLTIPVLILSRLSWNELLKGLAGVAVLLAVLSKTVESMAKNPADLIATGVGLMAIAIAIRILADAVTVMGSLDLGTLVKGLGGVSAVLFALSKTVDSMSKNPADLIATGIGIVAIAISIKILASAVSDFGSLDIGTIIKGILALGVVLLILENFTKGVGDVKNILQTAAAMLVLGVAMKVIASAMGDFGAMEWESIAKGLIVMAIALKAISEALERTPKGIFTSSLGFVVIAGALKILASALKDFAEMSWEDIAKAMTVLAGSLLILSLALILMEGTLPGAYAMGIAAASMVLMALALTMFGNLSWEQLLVGLAALAGIFVLFGLAGLILAPVVPVLIALGIAMALIGFGLVGIGVGMAIFVAGLVALTAAGLALGPAMVIIVGSILALIPLAMAELGKGIVAFAEVIGNAMPIFLDAFVKLLETLLKAIDIVWPHLMSTLWMIIVSLVELVVRGVPLFVDAGMKIIIGILTGIGNNMGKLLDAATKVIVEFINGISRNLPQIIQAGVNLIISFVEGLAKAVRSNSDRMATAGLDLAQAIIDGMVNGISKGISRVAEAATNIAKSALDTVKGWLGIKSPSREFFKIGAFSSEGMANGLINTVGMVVSAARTVGKSALDTLKSTMSNVGSNVVTDMDLSPRIRPVLDLSAIKKDSGLIDGLLTPASLSVAGSYNKATAISAAERVRKESAVTNVETATASEPTSAITFIQNNNSPKALSAADLYRNTKNQLSVVKKGELVK